MICATVATQAAATSLRTLIEAATPGQLPANFSGRVSEIHLQWINNTVSITWILGDIGNFVTAFHRLQIDRRELVLKSCTNNQLSLDEIFAVGGGSSMRILAFSV